ncbi:MAG: serine protease Do, partial [Planctomycetota bacterium]
MLSLLLTLFTAAAPQGTDLDQIYDQLQEEERITPEVRIVQAVVPCVVFIETESVKQGLPFGSIFTRTYAGSGSGVVVHPDGYIVTNYHVVAGASTIKVSFARVPGQLDADLVSFQRTEDLALLRIRGGGNYPTVRLGTSSDLLEAERVVAIGNPYGQTHTVSKGIISGLHRDVRVPDQSLAFTDLIQTDASINFGNSGGPLLNIRGELIGINTAMNAQAENIGFAIPVDRIKLVLNDILFPQARKSWLGFELAPDQNLTVGRVWGNGPGEEAGICSGDQIVAVGGREVASPDEFLHASLELEPRQRVEIRLKRGDSTETTVVNSWDRLDGLL